MTRVDWINAALAALVDEPVDQLKVLSLAEALSVSRSSFYWYFDDRAELLDELLALWAHNTESIVDRSAREAKTVAAACLGVFECWGNDQLYNPSLDLAVRDWGRRDSGVAARVEASDQQRLQALAAMFGRHGFNAAESTVRARLLYHSQVGYYTLGTAEPIEARLAYLPYYVQAMAGVEPTSEEIESFEAFLATVKVIG